MHPRPLGSVCCLALFIYVILNYQGAGRPILQTWPTAIFYFK